MKRLVLVGALVGAVAAGRPSRKRRRRKAAAQGGHTAPKAQPATEAAPAAPEGQVALGSVQHTERRQGRRQGAGGRHLSGAPDAADGTPAAKGQTAALERWVEFVQGGKVMGREVVTIVPQAEIAKVQKDTPPRPNGVEGRDAEGRRLHARLDQQGRQSLPDALASA